MCENMMNGQGLAGMGFSMINMALFWIGIITLLVWVFRGGGKGRSRTEATALEVLQKRYANGEIRREEYEQKRRDLGHLS
jgi:putative membrane protein